jgi:fatty acid desaturase
MATQRLWSAPRILVDILVWTAIAMRAAHSSHRWATTLAIAVIGAVPMHDMLVHGHEGAHRHLARTHWLNELLTWLTHAHVGLSGTAYRRFHLAHHRWVQTPRDPEYRLLDSVAKGAPGWSYLGIPFVAHLAVNTYPFRSGARRPVLMGVARDLAGVALLHGGLLWMVGTRAYLAFVLAPTFTSLSAVVVLRSVCEHHGTPAGDKWTNTRTMNAGRVLDLLWSNTSYHLEHHLFPATPFHKLPALRAALQKDMRQHGSAIDDGFWRTAPRLLRAPRHFTDGRPLDVSGRRQRAFVDARGLDFKMKVRWFRDLLASPAARQHLWNLYYAGEAYVELHPDAVFITRLEPRLGALLRRHLDDETRHAMVFRDLLTREGAQPSPLPETEDVGFFLLTNVLPEIRPELDGRAPFSRALTQRYMAFLHVLELRSLGDLWALITAARQRGETALANQLQAILADERFHASYTHREVMRLAETSQQALALLDEVRRAERQHYTAALLTIVHHFEKLGGRPRGMSGWLRWNAMTALATAGLAVRPLPRFETLPGRLVHE